MAAASAPLSVDEYLSTSFSPDCDYLDGFVVQRNVGKKKQSYTQVELGALLRVACKQRGLFVLTEQRTAVAPFRYRIPDVSVIDTMTGDITTEPPLLCVEVLSPDDRWSETNSRIGDYQAMGVPCVWVVDPFSRRAWIFEADQAPFEVVDGQLRARSLDVALELADVLPPAE